MAQRWWQRFMERWGTLIITCGKYSEQEEYLLGDNVVCNALEYDICGGATALLCVSEEPKRANNIYRLRKIDNTKPTLLLTYCTRIHQVVIFLRVVHPVQAHRFQPSLIYPPPSLHPSPYHPLQSRHLSSGVQYQTYFHPSQALGYLPHPPGVYTHQNKGKRLRDIVPTLSCMPHAPCGKSTTIFGVIYC